MLSSNDDFMDVYLDTNLSKYLTTLNVPRFSGIDESFLERSQVSRMAQLQMLQTLVLDYTQVQVDSLYYLPKSAREVSLIGAGTLMVKGRVQSRAKRVRPSVTTLQAAGATVLLAFHCAI